MRLVVYADGSLGVRRGGLGASVRDGDGFEVGTVCRPIGRAPSSGAIEYEAMCAGVCRALLIGGTELVLWTDSEGLASRLGSTRGRIREAFRWMLDGVSWEIGWIPREENWRADHLARLAARSRREPVSVLVAGIDVAQAILNIRMSDVSSLRSFFARVRSFTSE